MTETTEMTENLKPLVIVDIATEQARAQAAYDLCQKTVTIRPAALLALCRIAETALTATVVTCEGFDLPLTPGTTFASDPIVTMGGDTESRIYAVETTGRGER